MYITPHKWSYSGMGYYNVIVIDNKNFCHCFLYEGSSDLDRLYNYIAYRF